MVFVGQKRWVTHVTLVLGVSEGPPEEVSGGTKKKQTFQTAQKQLQEMTACTTGGAVVTLCG